MRTALAIGLCAWLAGVLPAGAQPRLSNGDLRQTPVSGSLTRAAIEHLAPTGPAWVGYAVPSIPGEHQMCCWNGGSNGACCEGCRLELGSSVSGNAVPPPPRTAPIPLEGSQQFFVLYRVEGGQVTRIRMFSEDCPLDGGGLILHWFTGVRPADSVAILASFVAATSERKVADSALSALAMHQEPSALDRLIASARDGATTQIRGQALFWLAQRAGEKAVGAISEAISKDPETEVKRRAVFALSQLPKDEGVPLLIQLARTNTNPAVRKQAMFWLGQSKDPRALKFFEEVLFK
jgi:HEAT repeat protein